MRKTVVVLLVAFFALMILERTEAWAQAKPAPLGYVIGTKGTASVLSKAALAKPAALRQEIFPDDTLKTGLNANLKVYFTDQTMLSMNENSEIGMTQYSTDLSAAKRITILQMTRGRIKAQVPEIYDSRESRFEIRTPTALTATRGGDYVVWTSTQKGRVATGVAVTAGTVELTNAAGQSMTVAPGFFSMTSVDGSIGTPAPIQSNPSIQQLVQNSEVRTDPSVAAQVKLAQQQAPTVVKAAEVEEVESTIPVVIPGEQWVWYGGGGLGLGMGATNTPCTLISGSGSLPLGCTPRLSSVR